jgi:hypothetical protein
MRQEGELWEILVPTVMGAENKPIKTRYHLVWDKKVREITGGLTIFQPAKGHWVSLDGTLFEERMIPVRVKCTEAQIEEIADYTAKYYDQEAVMYTLISHKCVIKNYKPPNPWVAMAEAVNVSMVDGEEPVITTGGTPIPAELNILLTEFCDDKDSGMTLVDEEKEEVYQKHLYQHDCNSCVYLGSKTTERAYSDGRQADLYVCSFKDSNRIRTLIARYGDDGPDYQSGLYHGQPNSKSPIPDLQEAYRRAIAKGFVDRG